MDQQRCGWRKRKVVKEMILSLQVVNIAPRGNRFCLFLQLAPRFLLVTPVSVRSSYITVSFWLSLFRSVTPLEELQLSIAAVTNYVHGKPCNSDSESQTFILKPDKGWITHPRFIIDAMDIQEVRSRVRHVTHQNFLCLCSPCIFLIVFCRAAKPSQRFATV